MQMDNPVSNTVLLVDDEADVREVMGISLEDLGCEVIYASDGDEAIERFREHTPPIVLTDIKMPGMDGIELLEKIKRIDPETEVIMITGHGDMSFAVRSFRFDATDFITKPIGMEDLERALKRAREKITVRKQFYEYTSNLEAMLSEKSSGQPVGDARAEGLIKTDGRLPAGSGTLQEVLEHLPCYIAVYDPDLRIVETNSYFEENFGDRRGEHCYRVCMDREDPCPDCPVKKTFSRGKSCQHETEYITRDHRTRKVLVWTLPVFDTSGKTVEQVMSVATDLEQISELQDRLSSLGLMVGSLSHGIKGLLTGIDSGVYLINSGLAKENGQRTREGVQIVQDTTERLKRVVLDILFYAKERDFKKETIAVRSFVDEMSRVVDSKIQSYGFSFVKHCEEDPGEFTIDANCVLQAMMNIFENAINACSEDPDKSKAQIITLTIRPEEGGVCFDIADTGKGMDEETRNNMFNLFFSTRGSKGTGLGLFVTRQIIEDHGGSIGVESEPGKGSVVTVCIPREHAEPDS